MVLSEELEERERAAAGRPLWNADLYECYSETWKESVASVVVDEPSNDV